MKKQILLAAAGAFLVGSMAMAADAENSAKTTVDHSKNPITGTQTTTKKYKKKVKGENGSGHQVDVMEKTKQKTDGTVETKVEAEGSATETAH